MGLFKRLRAKRDAQQTVETLPGIALQIEDRAGVRFGPDSTTLFEDLEVGATGPGVLQCVFISQDRRATLKLSAEQARWLANAFNHWADSADTIPIN